MTYKFDLVLKIFSQMMVAALDLFPSNPSSHHKLSGGSHQDFPFDNLAQSFPSHCLCAEEKRDTNTIRYLVDQPLGE